MDNWLLDVQLGHGEFRTDQAALWLSDLELGFEFTHLARDHIAFFQAGKRRAALKRLLKSEDRSESGAAAGIDFSWAFDETGTIHARHIVTDHGWRIMLDRGLDIFQPYDMKDTFTFANRLQQYRPCKAFEITIIRNERVEK